MHKMSTSTLEVVAVIMMLITDSLPTAKIMIPNSNEAAVKMTLTVVRIVYLVIISMRSPEFEMLELST